MMVEWEFDLSEVQRIAADVDSRMVRCDQGAGIECTTLSSALHHYEHLCCEYRDYVRKWHRSIFSGRTTLQPGVEQVLQSLGRRLYDRALQLAYRGKSSQGLCSTAVEQFDLESVLWELHDFLFPWATPQLSVSPSARIGAGTDSGSIERARRIMAALPPLPVECQPVNPVSIDQLKARLGTLPPTPSDWRPDQTLDHTLARLLPTG